VADGQAPGARGGGPGRPTPAVRRWAGAVGHFWWDFLVGDTPEILVGVLVVVGALAVVCLRPGLRTAAALAAPVLVAGVLAASVRRAARRADRP
jgi:hypothetical protein